MIDQPAAQDCPLDRMRTPFGPSTSDILVARYRESDGVAQSIEDHLRGTENKARSFAGKLGLGRLGAVAGLAHDLGKYSSLFQSYIRAQEPSDEQQHEGSPRRGQVDHSSAGAQLVWQSVQAVSDDQAWLRVVGQMLAVCIASHHGGLMDCLSPEGEDRFGIRMAKDLEATIGSGDERQIRDEVAELLTSTEMKNETLSCFEKMRDGNQPRVVQEFILGLVTRFLFSALVDADRLSSADFEDSTAAASRYNGGYPEWASLAQKLESHLEGLSQESTLNNARRRVSDACRAFADRETGLYQLTVPTGGGKTLASLRFALNHAEKHGMDRIIYVAPYTSIIDQNAAVARTILQEGSNPQELIVLEHHSNLTPDEDTYQNSLLSENWDAPIVFTTAVQFLETLFGSGTRGARRMHQLANSVVIFDEVQTIPIRTIHLFNNAINFLVRLCGSTIVFCTATQPLLDRVDRDKGAARLSTRPEMIDDVSSLYRELRRVEVVDRRKPGGWKKEEIAATAVERMDENGSALVVVNTKAQARGVYRCIEADNVFHLSTSMCPAHRMAHLDSLKRLLDPDGPQRVICVSTQLIEAGVDIDFGSVIRSLAGLDSIAQAAGRCNRNNLRETGRVLIANSSEENLDKLPEIRRAQDVCERVLDEFRMNPQEFDNDLLSPKAMERYYQYYFFQRAQEMSYPVTPEGSGVSITLLSALSTNEQAVCAYKRVNSAAPPFPLRQSFKSAGRDFEVIDSPTQGVVVPYAEGERIIEDMLSSAGLNRKAELLRRAQRYSVSMFPNEIEELRQRGAVREIWDGSNVFCLDAKYYDAQLGVILETATSV